MKISRQQQETALCMWFGKALKHLAGGKASGELGGT